MDNFNEVAAFVRAVELGSFSAAAQELGVSPSAISRQVTHLENRLGVKLLQRSTRRLTLTAVGNNYFHRCEVALKEMRAAEADAMCHDDRLRGVLRIQVTPGIGQRIILPLTLDFMKLHRELEVFIAIDGQGFAPSRDVDCYITVAHRAESLGSHMASSEIGSMSYVVCAAPSYIERFGRPKSIEALSDHNCIIHEGWRSPRLWRFHRRGKEVAVNVSGSFSTNHALVLEQAVLAGQGIGRIPTYAASPYIKSKRLVVLFQNVVTWGQVVAAYFPNGPQSARLKAYLLYLQAEVTRRSREFQTAVE